MRRFLCFAVALLAAMVSGPAFGGLMQYWTFDSDFSNSATGGIQGTVMGSGVSIGTGADEFIRGTGSMKISHDTATGDYFHLAGAAIPDYYPCSFTVTTWYKFDDTLGTQATDERNFLFETFPTWSAGAGLRNDAGVRDIECYFEGSDISVYEQNGPVVNDGQWHHLAMVYDHAEGNVGSINLYFDGILSSMLASNVVKQPIQGMNIGDYRAGDGGRNWKGYIDDFAVYNGTIDDAGVMGLYYGTYTPETVPVLDGPDPPPAIPTTPLQAYWTFDSNYTSKVNNEFYEGIPHGGTYTSITKTSGEYLKGTGALKLDSGPGAGNGTYVEIPREVADVSRDKQITVSAWYNYTDISGDGSDSRPYVYETSPGYSLSFGLRAESGTYDAEWFFQGLTPGSDTTGPIITPGEWNHVVMVYDAEVGRAQFYHNGELRDDVAVSGTLPAIQGLNIGNHRAGDGGRDFDGFIDDVAVYHGVLTPEAVAGLYGGTYTPQTVPIADSLGVFPDAEAVEEGWSLAQVIEFQNPNGLVFDDASGNLYAGRRGRGVAEDGVYEIVPDGTATQVYVAENPAALVSTGDALFVSFDYPGTIRKLDPVAQTDELWVDGFENDVDDDCVGMVVVPDGYSGPDFGGRVSTGKILSVDRGAGGFEEVWVWSPDTPQGEFAIISDGDAADGVGSVFVDPSDITIADNRVFVADTGASKIFELTDLDTAVELTLSGAMTGPRSMITDPKTQDLFVLTNASSVVRIDIDTGDLSVVIEGTTNSGQWDGLAISQDGTRLFVGDFGLDRIYEFVLASTAIDGDLNGDGFVGSADLDIVRSNWGQSVSGAAQGDPSGDGVVGSADLDVVRANWGATAQAAAVPEPSAILLLVAGIVAAASARRRW